MTVNEHIDKIWAAQEAAGAATPAIMAMVDEAIGAFPESPRLWNFRGNLIQMGSEDSPYELGESLRSYQRAVEVDPEYATGYESIGFYFDALEDDPVAAEPAFRKAVELGGGRDSHFGLARTLAELNRATEALELLDPKTSPFADDENIVELRKEIESGRWDRDDL